MKPKQTQQNSHAILAAASIGFFILTLDTTVVSIALPSIGQALHGTTSNLQWITDVYLLFLAGFLLSAGKIADVFGARRVFMTAVGGFVIMSAMCAFASSSFMLEIARALQGIAGAFILPASLSMIRESYQDPGERTRAVAIWTGSGGIAVAIGPVISGIFTQTLGWQSIFIINIPVCLFAILLVWLQHLRRVAPKPVLKGIDIFGQILSFLTIAGATFCLIQGGELGWTSPWIIGGIIATLVLFVIFSYRETHIPNAAIPLKLFRFPLFSTVNFTGFSQNFAAYGLLFILSLLFQQILHYPPLTAGLLYLPMTASVTASNLLTGKIALKYGHRRPLLIGLILLMSGLALCLFITDHVSIPVLCLLLLPIGLGAGMIVPPITSLALNSVEQSMAGVASGMLSTSRQCGSIVGIAVFGTLVGVSATFIDGFHISIIVCLLTLVVALALSLRFVHEPL